MYFEYAIASTLRHGTPSFPVAFPLFVLLKTVSLHTIIFGAELLQEMLVISALPLMMDVAA